MKRNVILMIALFVAAIGAAPGGNSLSKVVDIPLPGNPNRFDYQNLDPQAKILYLNHMNDGELVIFDVANRKVVDHLKGFPRCTGVIVVPSIQKVFVSTPGSHEVAIVHTKDHSVLARVPAGNFPDGLAYSPDSNRVYVSDESGGKEIIIDAASNKRVAEIIGSWPMCKAKTS
jgi:DNA-binding beta-propeller fold protein YncE